MSGLAVPPPTGLHCEAPFRGCPWGAFLRYPVSVCRECFATSVVSKEAARLTTHGGNEKQYMSIPSAFWGLGTPAHIAQPHYISVWRDLAACSMLIPFAVGVSHYTRQGLTADVPVSLRRRPSLCTVSRPCGAEPSVPVLPRAGVPPRLYIVPACHRALSVCRGRGGSRTRTR